MVRGAGRIVWLAFLLVGLQALFAVPFLALELSMPGLEPLPLVLLPLAVTVLTGWALWTWRVPALEILQKLSARFAAIPRRRWLTGVLVAGIVLRLAWSLTFPAPQRSDAGTYFELGARLARGEAYVTPVSGTRSEWPPGLPFLLSAAFRLAGIGRPAVILLNLLLFVGSLLIVDALARRLAGEPAARLATLVFAFWPNLITSVGIANKEAVAVLALTLSLLLYLRGRDPGPGQPATWLGAGLALGLAALAQPALLLLPAAFVGADLVGRTPLRQAVAAWFLLAVGMGAVIAPWTARNEQVLGEPVLLSTNGGSVFYRSNNPLATGDWIRHGERRLDHLGELEASEAGYRWGVEWIRENPDDFLALSVRKQILFLGDDAVGVYETLKRGLGIRGTLYTSLKIVANVWWWGLWLVILAAFSTWRAISAISSGLPLLLLAVLYFWTIDSVFESGARHHVPLAGVIAVLAGSAAKKTTSPPPKPGLG